MSSESSPTETIFGQAIAIADAIDRAAFLDRACGHDPVLRSQLEKLVLNHFRAGSFLEGPVVSIGASANQPTIELPGAQIGPYKLLQEIGEGGMGVVYLANQTEPVQRRVALKIIKPGMDSRKAIARFEAERHALALMDHPNIAKVLDAGATESGRLYFVMELVKGVPITTYCDEQQLTPRERLGLFLPVCQAVQHAHQKGIIHRDLKPSNVMVALYDGRPIPKVIDFGVAKATAVKLTEKTLFTEFGQVVGTPEYMSPEQAQLNQIDIDTRSDIYSLGVLLYELLTGTTPLERKQLHSAAFDEMLRMIREEEPPKPSTRLSTTDELPSIAAHRGLEPKKLSGLVRGDLDWIVMKALEKDRSRRYETANGLSMDIERYLSDEPVLACPPSATYRFRKFARRNRTALLTATVVAVALVVGTVVSTWQAVRATHAEQLAESQQRIAEANFQQVRKVVDEYFTQVSENKLLDVPGLQLLRKDLLEAALRFYQKVADERGHDPAALVDLAVTYLQLGEVYSATNHNEEAVAALGRALDVVDRLLRDYSSATQQHRRLGGTWKGRRHAQTIADLPTNLRAAQRELERMIDTWRKLADRHPDVVGFRSDMAASYYRLGHLFGSERPNDAAAAFKSASSIWEKLSQAHPTVAEYRSDLAKAYEREAWGLRSAGRPQEVTPLIRQCLAVTEKLVADFPTVPQYRGELADILLQIGAAQAVLQPRAAEEVYRRAMELAESLVRDYPSVEPFRNTWSAANDLLAKQAEANDNSTVIEETLRSRIHIQETLAAYRFDDNQIRIDLASTLRRLARHLARDPLRSHETEQLDRQVLAVLANTATAADAKLVGDLPDSGDSLSHLVTTYYGIAQMQTGQERLKTIRKAVSACRRAIGATEKLRESPATSRTSQATLGPLGVPMDGMAAMLNGSRDYPEEVEISQEFIEVSEKLAHVRRNGFANFAHTCAWLSVTRGHEEEYLRRGVAAFERCIADEPTVASHRFYFAQTLSMLGARLLGRDEVGEAEVALSRCIALDPTNSFAYCSLASLFAKQNKYDEAIASYRKAIDLNPKDSWSRHTLADLLAGQNLDDEAIGLYRAAIDLNPSFVWSHVNLARLLAKQMNLPEALAESQSALRMDPDEPQAHACLREVLNIIGDHAQTLAVLRETARLLPKNKWAFENLGNSLNEQQQTDEAIAAFSKAVELDPNCFAAHIYLAQLFASQNKLPVAKAALVNAIEHAPKDAQPLNQLAWILATSPAAELRDEARAVELATKAIELDPQALNIPNTLGVAHYRAGNWREALQWLDKSMHNRGGGDGFDWFFLAMSHWQSGNGQEARQWFDKAVEWMNAQRPNDKELGRFRAEAAELLGVTDDAAPKKGPGEPLQGKDR